MALPSGNKPESTEKSYSWKGYNFHEHFGGKLMITFLGILLVYGIFFVGTLIRNNIKSYQYIGKAPRMQGTVTVSGVGKVNGSNDIAVTTLGYSNVNKDVAKAQAENKKVMDQISAELKKMGVADKDMQSNYSIYPEYNYTQEKGQTLNGYRVTNSITVKIRDLSKISNILSLAGKYGATEVSGLNFTIDDLENLKSQARDKALTDVKEKANKLGEAIGMRLGGVISYNEYEMSPDMYNGQMFKEGSGFGGGYGGGPGTVSSGSKDVIMNVNVTYEVL
jgi:uncharacterized protein YggE